MSEESLLKEYISSIKATDKSWAIKAHNKLNSLAMPEGALGDLNDISLKLCAVQETLKPKIDKPICVVSVADHGVMVQGVSKYPQITDAIVKTALNGGAAINSFCKANSSELSIVDFGLAVDLSHEKLINCKVRSGTEDMSLGPAMSREQCLSAIHSGIQLANEEHRENDLLVLGEIGLGNTSAAAALFAALYDLDPCETTGAGTGVQGEALQKKIEIIRRAIKINQPEASDPIDCLMKVGGLEIAGMVGLILGFAQQQKLIVLDGYITGAAALVAQRLCPQVTDYLFAGHQSAEAAHGKLLGTLQLKPILQMNMRLGEGVGGVLALNTLRSSCEILNSMMTLDEALSL